MPLAVCATPIGNLDDVTLRVLAELREALAPAGHEVRLALAELGQSAGLIGAGLIGFEALG